MTKNLKEKSVDVSIIIVSWNTRQSTCECIQSIFNQTSNLDYKVFVIDNASSDDSVSMIKSEFPQVHIIENLENKGFASANNQGIAIAKSKYVLLLNSDTIICDNAIEKTLRYADKHPDVAVVGCQVLEDASNVQMTCFRFPSVMHLILSSSGFARIFKYNRLFGRESMMWWKRDTVRDVDVVSGMFLLVRREAIDLVGVMDEDYFLYYEESDWCYRFKKAGWKNMFWPGAKIIHVHGGSKSTDQAAIKMFVQKQKSLLIFIRKHKGLLQYWLCSFILSLSFCFRVFAWLLLMVSKKITGKNAGIEFMSIQKHWDAFKYCAFRYQSNKDR